MPVLSEQSTSMPDSSSSADNLQVVKIWRCILRTVDIQSLAMHFGRCKIFYHGKIITQYVDAMDYKAYVVSIGASTSAWQSNTMHIAANMRTRKLQKQGGIMNAKQKYCCKHDSNWITTRKIVPGNLHRAFQRDAWYQKTPSTYANTRLLKTCQYKASVAM